MHKFLIWTFYNRLCYVYNQEDSSSNSNGEGWHSKKKAHPNIFKTVTLLKYEQATTEVSLIYLAIGSKGGICERILRIDFHYKRKVWSRELYIICTS